MKQVRRQTRKERDRSCAKYPGHLWNLLHTSCMLSLCLLNPSYSGEKNSLIVFTVEMIDQLLKLAQLFCCNVLRFYLIITIWFTIISRINSLVWGQSVISAVATISKNDDYFIVKAEYNGTFKAGFERLVATIVAHLL